jgi:hypothetical protein
MRIHVNVLLEPDRRLIKHLAGNEVLSANALLALLTGLGVREQKYGMEVESPSEFVLVFGHAHSALQRFREEADEHPQREPKSSPHRV